MKGKLNNKIFKYETERERLKISSLPTPCEMKRLEVVEEILKVLRELRN